MYYADELEEIKNHHGPVMGLVREMLAAMALRETAGTRPEAYEHLLERVRQYQRGAEREEMVLVHLYEALTSQDQLELGKCRIDLETLRLRWDAAKRYGAESLNSYERMVNPEKDAVYHLMMRTDELGRSLDSLKSIQHLKSLDLELYYPELLFVVARMHGHSSYQALDKALTEAKSQHLPAFCLHCGTAASVEPDETVNPPAAQDGSKVVTAYRCRSCSGTFTLTAPAQ